MASATAVVIRTSGDVEYVTLPETDAHVLINETVGGWFDCVNGEDFVMYVHDEGLLIDLDPNIAASVLSGRVIAGDVVMVGSLNENGYNDGENHDVPSRFLRSDFVDAVKVSAGIPEAVQMWHDQKDEILARGPVIMSWDDFAEMP